MNVHEEISRKSVVSLNIDLISYRDALNKIIGIAKQKQHGYVCFANVHMTIEAYENKIFADQVNKSTLVLSDGVPLAKAIGFFYGLKQERIAGMDAFPDLLKLAEDKNLKVFFFGSTDEVLKKIISRIGRDHPNLSIAGSYSPPFNESMNDEKSVNIINETSPDLVFVALGCPKQEKWMAVNFNKTNGILLGVGGAFSVYAGLNRRAPKFMQDFALEWLYRLYQEPGRLFKRYFKTNSLFIYLVLKQKLRNYFTP